MFITLSLSSIDDNVVLSCYRLGDQFLSTPRQIMLDCDLLLNKFMYK